MGEHTFSQATKRYLKHPFEDPQRKFIWILSNLAATALGIVNRDKKYVGRLERVLFSNVSLPPLD